MIDPQQRRTIRRFTYIILAATLLIGGGFVWTGPMHTLAVQMITENQPYFSPSQPSTAEAEPFIPLEASIPGDAFIASDLINHPDYLHGDYISRPFVSLNKNHAINTDHLKQFRDLLNIYEQRQAEDDNFTVRVIDRRTNGLLERRTLANLRDEFMHGGDADWETIDDMRSALSSRLIGKYRRRGVPMEEIMIKWGRLDQVHLARERDKPFIEYEINLSHTLGLSLLATEIGTVETFNLDTMISTVGARGRYQMMPYMLRRFDIHTYTLWTRSGLTVEVREEWHPLLTMEPAFTIIKGYSNGVGHEIPGISAYHTGPFNIFHVYNMYLEDENQHFAPSSTVMDAYMWAVTEGFPEVSELTGFKHYSRSYVATAYGSFRGTENIPIDTSLTHQTERIQTVPNVPLYLSELLGAIEPIADQLNWSFASADTSLYTRFRAFNPHFALPELSTGERIPRGGDVYLTTRNTRRPVRFFLPVGTAQALAQRGHPFLSLEDRFQFDHDTYRILPEEITVWDRQYAELVDDIKYFGFTEENKDRLNILVQRFEKLATTHPTTYRNLQLNIIKLHQNLWRTRYWKELNGRVSAAAEKVYLADHRPPSPIGLTQRISVADIELTASETAY